VPGVVEDYAVRLEIVCASLHKSSAADAVGCIVDDAQMGRCIIVTKHKGDECWAPQGRWHMTMKKMMMTHQALRALHLHTRGRVPDRWSSAATNGRRRLSGGGGERKEETDAILQIDSPQAFLLIELGIRHRRVFLQIGPDLLAAASYGFIQQQPERSQAVGWSELQRKRRRQRHSELTS